MKSSKVEFPKYDDIYAFACASESNQDFNERMVVLSQSLMIEFQNRVNQVRPISPFTLTAIIDTLNKEINTTFRNINTTEIVENQPKLYENSFLTLVRLNSRKVFSDYNYVKQYALN